MKISKKLLYSSLVGSLNSMMYGVNLTVIACFKDYLMNKGNLSDSNWSIIATIIYFGALIGNLSIIFLKFKWRYILMVNYLIHICGSIGFLFFGNIFLIGFFRLLTGIAVGFGCGVVPMYLANISPVQHKGFVGSLQQLFITIGVSVGQLISYFCEGNWKYALGILIAIYLISLILTNFIQDEDVVHKDSVSLFELLRTEKAYKSILILIALHVCQKFSGLNSVVLFSNEMMKNNPDSKRNTVILGLISIVSTLISMKLVDTIGRKIVTIFSICIVVLSTLLLSFDILTVFSLFLFMFGFYSGLGPITWVIVGDTFPQIYQPAASVIGVSLNWMLAFIVSSTYKFVYDFMKNYVFGLYSIGTSLTGFYIFIAYRESKGSSEKFQ